jgi:polar amino acid transport system permease protein
VVYIDIFRGAPALLVILTLGFGMTALRIEGLPTSAIFWGTMAIILSSSAYQAETFRAGIESVHASQRAAARSLGLSNSQAMRYVVLPQGIRRVIPPTLSGFVGLQKETALVSVIGPLEATRQAQIYAGMTFNFTSYVVAGVLFIAITIPLARLTDYLLQRTAQRREIGGAV